MTHAIATLGWGLTGATEHRIASLGWGLHSATPEREFLVLVATTQARFAVEAAARRLPPSDVDRFDVGVAPPKFGVAPTPRRFD